MNISIITATKNRKNLLATAMQSVQMSTCEPLSEVRFEHIIIDDGSTDGTEQWMKTKESGSVHYIRFPKSRGQSVARNEAIRHATGEYIFILDDDDVILQRTVHNFSRAALE